MSVLKECFFFNIHGSEFLNFQQVVLQNNLIQTHFKVLNIISNYFRLHKNKLVSNVAKNAFTGNIEYIHLSFVGYDDQ